MSDPSSNRPGPEELQRLLAQVAIVRTACDLDLLVFLHRHPRTLLTNEQLAAFVGYDTKQVARTVDGFIEAGLVERTQNPKHAARMYLLRFDDPQGKGLKLKRLLDMASTRRGRHDILNLLSPERPEPTDIAHAKRRLHAIA